MIPNNKRIHFFEFINLIKKRKETKKILINNISIFFKHNLDILN